MAAPTPDSKTAEALNVAMCTTPIGPIRTQPGITPPLPRILRDQSPEGEWKEVVA